MASPAPQKRSFEAADLEKVAVYQGISVSSSSVPEDLLHRTLQCMTTSTVDTASRETSPLSSVATLISREPSATPATVTAPNTTNPPKRRKLTVAEKEVQRLEKQFKDQQKTEEKAGEKAKKDEEKRLKEEERRIKEAEAKETKRMREEEREEKRKIREAEKQLKDEEKRKRDAEKKAKDDEKLKKENVGAAGQNINSSNSIAVSVTPQLLLHQACTSRWYI